MNACVGWRVSPSRARWCSRGRRGRPRRSGRSQSKDGKTNFKFGFLAQPQLEVLETPDGSGSTRRTSSCGGSASLFGGKICGPVDVLLRDRQPQPGEGDPRQDREPDGAKDAGFMYLQDAYVTYDQGDAFKVDAGMIMTPLGHNHNQSAATLLPVDYGPLHVRRSRAHGHAGRARLRRPAARLPVEAAPGIPPRRLPGGPRRRGAQRASRGGTRGLVPLCGRHRLLLRRHVPGDQAGVGDRRQLRRPGGLPLLRGRRVRRAAVQQGPARGDRRRSTGCGSTAGRSSPRCRSRTWWRSRRASTSPRPSSPPFVQYSRRTFDNPATPGAERVAGGAGVLDGRSPAEPEGQRAAASTPKGCRTGPRCSAQLQLFYF